VIIFIVIPTIITVQHVTDCYVATEIPDVAETAFYSWRWQYERQYTFFSCV